MNTKREAFYNPSQRLIAAHLRRMASDVERGLVACTALVVERDIMPLWRVTDNVVAETTLGSRMTFHFGRGSGVEEPQPLYFWLGAGG